MKLCGLFLLLAMVPIQALLRASGGGGHRDLSHAGGGKLKDVLDCSWGYPHLNSATLQSFLSDMDMVLDADYEIHDVSDGSLKWNNAVFTLDDMESANVYTDMARLVVDGQEVDDSPVCVFSKIQGGERLVASIMPGGRLESIMIVGVDNSLAFFKAVRGCLVIQVEPDKIDLDKFPSTMVRLDVANDQGGRGLVTTSLENIDLVHNFQQRNFEECSNNVVGVAVAVDSSLCGQLGGRAQAIARVETIIEVVSTLYQVSGICEEIKLSFLEVHCHANTDPYREMVEKRESSCASGIGSASEFKQMWSSGFRRYIPRYAALLFVGTPFEGTTAGCSSLGGVCNFGAGVNHITFSNNTRAAAVLVAHELGHVLGADHVERPDGAFVMETRPMDNLAADGFSLFSRAIISSTLEAVRSRGLCPDFRGLPPATAAPTTTTAPTMAPTVRCKEAVTINGTEGDDFLVGSHCDDVIFGLGGDDTILGLGGNDKIVGGDGNDRLEGNNGKDSIFGGMGDDFILGGSDADIIRGEDGSDYINGGNADDFIVAGSGNDVVFGSNGDDKISGGGGFDSIGGGDGQDVIFGNGGADTLNGSNGEDFINGGGGDDEIRGGKDGDFLLGGYGNDIINGGEGPDIIGGFDGMDLLNGSEGDDFLYAGEGDETIFGGIGYDQVSYADPTDKIIGVEKEHYPGA